MARKIIILEQVGEPADYRVAFWLDVPAERQAFYANTSATSTVIGATAPEIAAIKAGQVVEVVRDFPRDNGVTNAHLRTALQTAHAQMQARLVANNIWNRYGTSWDGTTWTAVTVA
jgi:hypothetical protein